MDDPVSTTPLPSVGASGRSDAVRRLPALLLAALLVVPLAPARAQDPAQQAVGALKAEAAASLKALKQDLAQHRAVLFASLEAIEQGLQPDTTAEDFMTQLTGAVAAFQGDVATSAETISNGFFAAVSAILADLATAQGGALEGLFPPAFYVGGKGPLGAWLAKAENLLRLDTRLATARLEKTAHKALASAGLALRVRLQGARVPDTALTEAGAFAAADVAGFLALLGASRLDATGDGFLGIVGRSAPGGGDVLLSITGNFDSELKFVTPDGNGLWSVVSGDSDGLGFHEDGYAVIFGVGGGGSLFDSIMVGLP